MTLEQFIGFSVFAFVACVTPGPNNMLLTAVGGSRGIRRGLPTLMGVAFGFALMLFLVAIGVGRTVLALEHFSGTVRWVGAAFLIWLAWNIASAPVANAGASDNAVPRRRDGTGLVGAAFFQWVNPKAWLVCVGAISTYLSPGEDLVVQATTFAIGVPGRRVRRQLPVACLRFVRSSSAARPRPCSRVQHRHGGPACDGDDSRRASRTARVSEIGAESSIAHESRFDR